MDAIHLVKVLLFWDSEIARDTYGRYFIGVLQKGWTLPTNRMISHAELVSKILKYGDMDQNLWSVRMTMKVPSYYENHHMSYFNLFSMNNDNEMRYLWTITPGLAKEGIHILIEFIQIQQQTISSTQVINTTNMTEHVTAITQMVSHEPSMLYTIVTDDDAEIDNSDEDYVTSSQSESNDNNDVEKEELQTPIIPITKNAWT
ncbi:hypothetical protein M9H77_12732 [Catharanthus roseus]|uniref:Uncharacterized protein n=1 Tax=Catharanthus roseus TaxID=4058 RepID=A0ACC0BIG2_CATRO|nr:hypothetical protein M9H77_12732 [Catharanthus roseus]